MSISIGLYPNLDLWNANKLHYNRCTPSDKTIQYCIVILLLATSFSLNGPSSGLEYTAEMKFLGIHIMETLKWNSHVVISKQIE